MSFLRHIHACNPPIEETFWPWTVANQVVGWIRPAFAAELRRFGDVFVFGEDAIGLDPGLHDFTARSEALEYVARALAENGVTPPHMAEPYPVTASGRESALCVVDRAAAAHFGVRSFGQHLNGYVERDDGMHMWIGRRARDRLLFPGALDNMVAGGLPYDLDLEQNLVKECHEEAGVPETLARLARPVGVVTYNRVAQRGLRRDVLYCYDLAVPADFEPRNTDGEVEAFMLLPLAEVARLVHDTDEFKLNCNLVVIDFLIRHGWLDPQDPEYLALTVGLRPPVLGAEQPGANRI